MYQRSKYSKSEATFEYVRIDVRAHVKFANLHVKAEKKVGASSLYGDYQAVNIIWLIHPNSVTCWWLPHVMWMLLYSSSDRTVNDIISLLNCHFSPLDIDTDPILKKYE